jgi:serine/threonine protein kinase
MSPVFACDEDLVRRLPLPLAQLYRRAHNAKTPQERHQAAFFLWEAALKLLASVAVVEYAEHGPPDDRLAERLQNLARPALGHWWEFIRLLVPPLAEAGDAPFAAVRDLLLGPVRDDLPRAAGLDAVLGEVLDGRGGARSTVRLSELFDRLVRYRNRELGHGAAGQRAGDFYGRVGQALLAGIPEILGRLNVLAGRRLLYVDDVRRLAGGRWLVERAELIGEAARRIESLDLPHEEASRLPQPECVYLEVPGPRPLLRPLQPLVVYDADLAEVHFLNARRGRQRVEHLCYTSGRVLERPEWAAAQQALLARVLDLPVDAAQAAGWAARSQAEEGPADDTPAETPRRHLGEFELLSELGRGGMGVVYRAWQPSLGRQVALKCLSQSGDPKAEARFAREIRALGRVEHPHLVKVFTSGADGERWFYAMELVEGASLAAVCDRLTARNSSAAGLDLNTWQQCLHTVCAESRQAEKPFGEPPAEGAPPRRAPAPPAAAAPPTPPVAGRGYVYAIVELVRQVAEAAHALHEAGVIHRDVKPGNIMVTADGSQGVLMDLGLAQLADDVEGRLTRTRQFVGTLRYASPEQVLAVGRLDRRSDVYSLGATLWELLTLRPLYGADEQTPTAELMRRIQYTDPERLRMYHPGVGRDLEAVVARCLEKDSTRRYASARELAEELGRFLAGEPVQTRPVGSTERAWRWCRRNPMVAGLLTAVAVALVGVATVIVLSSARENAFLRDKLESEERAKKLLGDKAAAERSQMAAMAAAESFVQSLKAQPDLSEWKVLQWVRKFEEEHGDPDPETKRIITGGLGLQAGVGSASCSAPACHGSEGSLSEGRVRQRESTIWLRTDPHARAFASLQSDRGRRIEKNLESLPGVERTRAEGDDRCLTCHAPAVRLPLMLRDGRVDAETGTGCESCHGRAALWLKPHSLPGWQSVNPEERRRLGLRMDVAIRVRVCIECHVGGADSDVNHDLIAAGPPWLAFDPAAHFARLPRHWNDRPPSPAGQAKQQAAGRLLTAQVALRLLTYRAEGPDSAWPEFAEYDCRSCHHDLGESRARTPAVLRMPAPWNPWYSQGLLETLTHLAPAGDAVPAGLENLRAMMERPNPDRVLIAARSWDLAGRLDTALWGLSPLQRRGEALLGIPPSRSGGGRGLTKSARDERRKLLLAIDPLDRRIRNLNFSLRDLADDSRMRSGLEQTPAK